MVERPTEMTTMMAQRLRTYQTQLQSGTRTYDVNTPVLIVYKSNVLMIWSALEKVYQQ